MRVSKSVLALWSFGFLMPVWLLIADLFSERLTGTNLPGGWLYVGIVAGAAVCGIAICLWKVTIWQRLALILASWLLLAGEVLLLGAFSLSQSGLKGVQ